MIPEFEPWGVTTEMKARRLEAKRAREFDEEEAVRLELDDEDTQAFMNRRARERHREGKP